MKENLLTNQVVLAVAGPFREPFSPHFMNHNVMGCTLISPA